MKWRWMLGMAAAWLAAGGRLNGEVAITVYNQDFAVVRDSVPLDLKKGVNEARFTGATMHLEPDSVVLRDPSGKQELRILEQNYRADPVSQELLMSLYEGKTIDFIVQRQEKQEIVKGKIVRSGYVPHAQGLRRYGSEYYQRQMDYSYGQNAMTPIIEIDGQLHFDLPGTPVFPVLADDTVLKPTLNWLIEADRAGKLDAEVCYITGGMSWEADYNAVAPETGEELDLLGWVTMDNQSGKTFQDAKIKLMAGDVSKIQRPEGTVYMEKAAEPRLEGGPPVSEKAFDEYHLYTLQRRTTLHDRETKQVEFVRAQGVKAERLYVYDGVFIDWNRDGGWDSENVRGQREYGTQCNPKVWVMREFKNSEANRLGIPLPKGKVRFYRRDDDGQLEFTGENVIDHTPKDELVRVYTGNAFDVVGERRQTEYKIDTNNNWLDESFEIKVRNHKKEKVEVRVVEHMYRWINWEVTQKSHEFAKTDARTAEFRVLAVPDGEVTIKYTVHYTW